MLTVDLSFSKSFSNCIMLSCLRGLEGFSDGSEGSEGSFPPMAVVVSKVISWIVLLSWASRAWWVGVFVSESDLHASSNWAVAAEHELEITISPVTLKKSKGAKGAG